MIEEVELYLVRGDVRVRITGCWWCTVDAVCSSCWEKINHAQRE